MDQAMRKLASLPVNAMTLNSLRNESVGGFPHAVVKKAFGRGTEPLGSMADN